MKIEFHPDAKSELAEIGEYYFAINPDLGRSFREEFDECLSQIAANPLRFEHVGRNLRRCLMHRFPYGIFFRMPDEQTVRIIIVRHHSRRSGLGMRRQ